ncbi:HK97 family phage prohead protease [Bosea sp. (in: a-proteobacteria)]|uniref:HK97 family phage prohead protease n=1 Tax=Bosea sp. (in: a-proteobacteria) TaxID=1871050 RepID=UPI003F715C6A
MAEISGYAIQWNKPAVIAGLFEERFAPGAFDASIREHPDVVALWSHDASRPLARAKNGTLTLRSDRVGLWYSLTPNPDSPLGQEAIATIGSGTLDQVSVGFASEVEEWEDNDDIPRRLVTRARLYEVSLVVWGAYGDATSAAIRSDNANAVALRARLKMEAAMRLRGITP